MEDTAPLKYSYFVIKCISLESLQKCVKTEWWAFRQRVNSPQPVDLLEKAHAVGKVILIFSVNNQHGWHGYCESLYPLKPKETEPQTSEGSEWSPFSVKWINHFLSYSSYACLPSEATKGLFCVDDTPVNQARNWQQMSQETGKLMCDLIDQHVQSYFEKLQTLEKEKQEAIKAKESFFEEEESSMDFAWSPIIEKVEKELGKVILACPYGSQRYNCSLPTSDSDILIIYQAKTTDILGLEPPPQTIKNSHRAKMDYTVLELQRYCELLAAGDPRYVETLYLEEESVLAFASESWQQLQRVRHLLLTNECLEKYLREAKGTRGLKQFERWKSEMADRDSSPEKMNKLAYIILRLLQSTREIVKAGTLHVFRENGSLEQQELLGARQGHMDVAALSALFHRYLDEIDELRPDASVAELKSAKQAVQNWLVEARLQDLK